MRFNSFEKPKTFFHSGASLEHYDALYARKYIERTLMAPYTQYKNRLLAETALQKEIACVVDIGGNVSGILKLEGSLRFQLENRGIDYVGVDLIKEYFDPNSARALGIPEENIYPSVNAVVADIEHLPFEDASVPGIVCADVIEHVPNPVRAFQEMSRVLSPEGRLLAVIPSMYKLDLFDFEYVEKIRSSSHASKLIIDDWEKMWTEAGLEIDTDGSKPIGIASGLSYLSWIDDEVIPERPELTSTVVRSEKSLIHQRAKNILSNHDEEIDALIFKQNLEHTLVDRMSKGDIKGALNTVRSVIEQIKLSQEEQEVLEIFFEMIDVAEYDSDRIEQIIQTFGRAKDPRLLLGNSVLVVLKHTE